MGYTPSFTPQYENGWENLPSETSPITAEAFNAYDDAIENMEEYLASDESQANLADAYDETATYEAGDYVIYGGDLYKCLEDIDEPEEWDSTKWESCLITDEMATSGGTTVIANPSGQATETLTKLQVEETIYGISGGGGSANIWEGTQAELEEEFDNIPNETAIIVTDDEQEVVEGGTIYSEEEQCIGLWKNNKPLYQKTFVTEKTNIVGNTAIDVNSDITPLNVGDIIGYENKLEYSLSGGTGQYWSDDLARLRQDNTNGYTILLTIGGATLSSVKIEWTIKYTKSTDAPLDAVVGKSTMYIASSDCYSTEEKEVGCWQDGKPLYQKTIDLGTMPNNASKTVAHGISNLDVVVSYEGFFKNPTSGGMIPFGFTHKSAINEQIQVNIDATNINILTAVDKTALTICYLTIQYTKTTDTAGSGKFTPAGTQTEHYSTEEQVIGTWFGETLYRKTVNFGALPNNATKTVAHGISNLKYIKSYEGTAKSTSNGYYLTLPYIHSTSASRYVEMYFDSTNISIATKEDRSVYDICYITLEYTKTV